MDILALLFLILIFSLFALPFIPTILYFRSKRKRIPVVVHVVDEKYAEKNAEEDQSKARNNESMHIRSLIERIKEIDEKISIVLEKDISDEAKRIVIHELEEEKKKLEEEVKRIRR